MAEKKNTEFVHEDVFFFWDELDRQDLPTCCMYCGLKDVEWREQRFETSRYENLKNYRVTRKSMIPLCDEHSGWLAQIRADDFDKVGIWMRNVGEDYREALKRHRVKEQKEWEEENDGADPDDFENSQLPPALRSRPEKPKKPSIWWLLPFGIFFLAIMLFGVAMFCLVFLFFGGVAFLGFRK